MGKSVQGRIGSPMLRFKEGKSTLEILFAFDIKGCISPSSSCLGASVKCTIELMSM